MAWKSLLTQTIERLVSEGWDLVARTDTEAILRATDTAHRRNDWFSFAMSGIPWFGYSKRTARKVGEFVLLRVGVMGHIVSWRLKEPIDLPSNEWPPPGSWPG
jgi:hypothetical protein